MNNLYNFFLWIFCISLIINILGCSSASNTIRYGNPNQESDKSNDAVRFSSTKNQNVDTAFNYNATSISDTDDTPINEKGIDISVVMKKLSSNNNTEKLNAAQNTLRDKMLMEIIKYLDTPYKYGGHTSNGIDCSAFTQRIYQKVFSITLLRSAHEQFTEGTDVDEVDDLKFGDLVFFNTRRGIKPGHVGIYIGNHFFAHASTSNGVIVSSIDDEYYSKRFMGGRRIENILGTNK